MQMAVSPLTVPNTAFWQTIRFMLMRPQNQSSWSIESIELCWSRVSRERESIRKKNKPSQTKKCLKL